VDASLAADLGASYVGVIFAPSPRRIDENQARAVFAATASNVGHVAVFGEEPNHVIESQAKSAGANVLQLHGGPTQAEIRDLRQRFDGEIWVVVPIERGDGVVPAAAFELADAADAILVDTSVAGRSGGTGQALDWAQLAESIEVLAARTRVILAGGLNPENVRLAIESVHPSMVDVSSGIEASQGIKDPRRMKAFAEAVRSASIVGRRSTPSPASEAE
jgi:phosphoribosylanthranilate isomerase